MYLELHRATLTTQSGVKRGHRAAERALIAAETAQSLACLIGGKAPENFETLWRVVLKNEFHDILPGSSIREVYQDAEAELAEVIAQAKESQRAAVEGMAALLPSGRCKRCARRRQSVALRTAADAAPRRTAKRSPAPSGSPL